MVNLAVWMFFQGRFVDRWAVVKTFAPTVVWVAVVVIVILA